MIFFVVATFLYKFFAQLNDIQLQLTNAKDFFFLLSLLSYFPFFKFGLDDHRVLFLFPINRTWIAILSIISEFFKLRILIQSIFSLFLLLTYSEAIHTQPQSFLLFSIFLFVLTTFFIVTKLSMSRGQMKWSGIFNIVLICGVVFLNYVILSYSVIVLYIILSLWILINVFILRKQIRDQRIIRDQSANILLISSLFWRIFKKNMLVSKELLLLLRSVRGFELVVHSTILFMLIFAISFYFPKLTPVHWFFGFLSTGIIMAEYFQYCFSWDYDALGKVRLLPISNMVIVYSKLVTARLIYVYINCMAIPFSIGHYNLIATITVVIFNITILPHVNLLFSYVSYQKVWVNKSTYNLKYYKRPIKLLIVLFFLLFTEFLFLIFSTISSEFQLWGCLFVGGIAILVLIGDNILVRWHSSYYQLWLKNNERWSNAEIRF